MIFDETFPWWMPLVFVGGLFGPAVLGAVLTLVLTGILQSRGASGRMLIWGVVITVGSHAVFLVMAAAISAMYDARLIQEIQTWGAVAYCTCLAGGVLAIAATGVWLWLHRRPIR